MVGFAVGSGSTVMNSSPSKPQVNTHLLDLCTSGSCRHGVFVLRDVGSCWNGSSTGSSGASLLAWSCLKSMCLVSFWRGLRFPDIVCAHFPRWTRWYISSVKKKSKKSKSCGLFFRLTPEGAASGRWHDFRTFVWKVESLISYLLNEECFHEVGWAHNVVQGVS